jgi:hypothetical protein
MHGKPLRYATIPYREAAVAGTDMPTDRPMSIECNGTVSRVSVIDDGPADIAPRVTISAQVKRQARFPSDIYQDAWYADAATS